MFLFNRFNPVFGLILAAAAFAIPCALAFTFELTGYGLQIFFAGYFFIAVWASYEEHRSGFKKYYVFQTGNPYLAFPCFLLLGPLGFWIFFCSWLIIKFGKAALSS